MWGGGYLHLPAMTHAMAHAMVRWRVARDACGLSHASAGGTAAHSLGAARRPPCHAYIMHGPSVARHGHGQCLLHQRECR